VLRIALATASSSAKQVVGGKQTVSYKVDAHDVFCNFIVVKNREQKPTCTARPAIVRTITGLGCIASLTVRFNVCHTTRTRIP
jgi:hypothetical protein